MTRIITTKNGYKSETSADKEVYAPLWCKSNYSFLKGASHPEELVETAYSSGLKRLALTDENGLYGVARAHVRARELGIELLVGSELDISGDSTNSISGQRLVVLAKNMEGYRNICELITTGKKRAPKRGFSLSLNDVAERSQGLVALMKAHCKNSDEDEIYARMLHQSFGDSLYLILARHREAGDKQEEIRIRNLSRRLSIPVLATCEVLYHDPCRQPLQDVLSCIREDTRIHDASAYTRSNHEHFLRTPKSFLSLYDGCEEAVRKSLEAALLCTFRLSELKYRYPVEDRPDGHGESESLRKLVFLGAKRRYGGEPPPHVLEQIEKELRLINELDYGGYFLTMHELVEFCRSRDILCQGRGSAANSVVCYCLGITAVDPVRMGLLFERFISRERAEPPDIDLDIAHERREEVIQHVYERFGRTHAAMVASVIRYRSRSAIRDIGKVLGIPLTSLDHLAKITGRGEDPTYAELSDAGLDPLAPKNRTFLSLVREIKGFPRHLSTHPGGFLIGREPVTTLVPVEKSATEGRTIIQWDKYDVEAMGLFKIDLLGLGALTLIHRCLKLVQKHRGRNLSLATIPPEDPRTFEMMEKADTVGVFQIESRAQMAMLPRLRPRRFYDLVIEISLVRPGPIAGDMVHPYLRRRQGLEPVVYPHPSLKPVLEKTLGVCLFQEQVMKLAMVAADYTPGEADQLRRDMAAWRREGRLEKHRDKMINRMSAKGIPSDFAEREFHQIQGFGEYGFPESHAASFALISYATAWLKCHYPAEFACALLNSQPMGFYSPATIVEDARRHGVTVLPVDINKSKQDCVIEPVSLKGFGIRMGLRYVKGLGKDETDLIMQAKNKEPFQDIDDFLLRLSRATDHIKARKPSSRSLDSLVQAGAMESLEPCRRTAAWRLAGRIKGASDELRTNHDEELPAFPPLSSLETITWDYSSSRHSARGHPLSALRPELTRKGFYTAAVINKMKNGEIIAGAGLVTARQRPRNAGGVVFLTLEDETGFINVVIRQDIYEKHRFLVKMSPFIAVKGRLQSEDDVCHLIAREIWVPLTSAPPRIESRDFH